MSRSITHALGGDAGVSCALHVSDDERGAELLERFVCCIVRMHLVGYSWLSCKMAHHLAARAAYYFFIPIV